MRRRFPAYATVVAAVIVFAVAGYVIVRADPPPEHGGTPGYSAGPVAATTPATIPVGTLIAFLGDDWTASTGAGSVRQGFVASVGASLHVPVRAFAVPGGGYAKRSSDGKTYAALVAAVVAAHPTVVVVSGGRNDVGDYVPTMQQAARDLFTALHRALPRAALVGVAPWWGDSQHPQELTPVAAGVQAAVTAAGGDYVDGPDPLQGHPNWMADDADPNAAGYAAIAAALVPRLRPLLAS